VVLVGLVLGMVAVADWATQCHCSCNVPGPYFLRLIRVAIRRLTFIVYSE
jgi:hypothetical protein